MPAADMTIMSVCYLKLHYLPEAVMSAGACAADHPAAASPPQSEPHWHWQRTGGYKGRDRQPQHPGSAQAYLCSRGEQCSLLSSQQNDAVAVKQQVCAYYLKLHEQA